MLTCSKAGGAIVKAGTSAVVKYGPKVAGKAVPFVKSTTPKATKWGSQFIDDIPKAIKPVAQVVDDIPGVANAASDVGETAAKTGKGWLRNPFTEKGLNKAATYANIGFAGWAAKEAVGDVADEFKGVDWEEVGADGQNGGAATEQTSPATAESENGAGAVNGAGLAGGAAQSATAESPSSGSGSGVSTDESFDPEELTLEELDQIQAGIDQQEQSFGDSPDPTLDPFFEGDASQSI